MTPQEQLQDLLRELFQLNNADLDFGIYRILNLKHKEVEEFIATHLPKRIEEVREKILARQSVDLRAEIENLKKEIEEKGKFQFQSDEELLSKVKQLEQLNFDFLKEPANKYIEAKKKLDALRISEDTERAIYNELYRFFDRYYEGGDFISKPRAGANNYMIPYNGEEVKLYWANYDQYYIKTSENFKNYIFTNSSPSPEHRITVEFKIVDAETTTNNNKDEKKRLFVPTEKPIEWNADERKLTVSFYYKEPSDKEKAKWGEKQSVKKEGKGINQRLYAELENAVKNTKYADLLRLWEGKRRTSRGEEVPLFLYHLNRYTSINSFDYFIHKDLKGFLRRELDYFLKNEVLSVNFLDPDWKENEVQEAIKLNILKAGAIRDLALTIIDFLGELEDFQKRLWEKKKFVVQSDYCLTLDTITDETVLSEVLDFVLNDKEQKQINEWKNLSFITDKRELKDLQKKLKNGDTHLKFLVLDTQFLPEDLKWKLLASIDNLDERTNGLLINSENWQALNVLTQRFLNRLDQFYIDPPFNTDSSPIAYKNNYKDSSWLALITNRVKLAKRLLRKSGIAIVAIDDVELRYLNSLLDEVFSRENFITCITTVCNPQGRVANKVSKTSEYHLVYAVSVEDVEGLSVDKLENRRSWTPFKRTGTNSRRDERPLRFYPILEKDGVLTMIDREEYEKLFNRETKMFNDEFLVELKKKYAEKGYSVILPQMEDGTYLVWQREFTRAKNEIDTYEIRGGAIYTPGYEMEIPKTCWTSPLFANPEYGTELLKSIIDSSEIDVSLNTAKSIHTLRQMIRLNDSHLIIDFFGGSGTTAHAVIDVNREDDDDRKYILVEMEEYFRSVTKPRIQKVIFSDKWKEGKPQEGGKGISQIFQYLKLEQYEDTLNNIEFTKDAAQLTIVDRLRYFLTYGTSESDCLLNVRKFTNPFGYTMKIVRQNEIVHDQPIDLVTTFNYFLGIDIKRYIIEKHQDREYRIVLGKKRQQEYIVVWRPYDEEKLDLTKEREWIKKQPWYSAEALIYCNAENGFGAQSVEAEFLRIMNEPVE